MKSWTYLLALILSVTTAHQMLVDTITGAGEDPNTFTFDDALDLGQKEINHCLNYNGFVICAWK